MSYMDKMQREIDLANLYESSARFLNRMYAYYLISAQKNSEEAKKIIDAYDKYNKLESRRLNKF